MLLWCVGVVLTVAAFFVGLAAAPDPRAPGAEVAVAAAAWAEPPVVAAPAVASAAIARTGAAPEVVPVARAAPREPQQARAEAGTPAELRQGAPQARDATAAVSAAPAIGTRPVAAMAMAAAAAVQPAPSAAARRPVVAASPPRPAAIESEHAASAAGRRVFVHHRAGSEGSVRATVAAIRATRAAGLPIVDVRLVTAVPPASDVRYFFADDAAEAARLARQLGPEWRVRDFRHYPRPPRAGTLEVWVAEP
jgi:hypothetical protein